MLPCIRLSYQKCIFPQLQSNLTQNALGRLLLLLSTSQAAASLSWPLSISSVRHHHMEIQLSANKTAPRSSTASWHGLYKPMDLRESEKKVKFQSLLLFYNTLYSNIRVCILGMTFYDGIS